MYIDDIFNVLPDNALVSYADDTAVLCSGNSWNEVNLVLTRWLIKLDHWLRENQLSLNIDKTTFITFGSYADSVPVHFQLKINNRELKRVDNCKYVGLFFDSHMKWNTHVNELTKKKRYFTFLFFKFSKCIKPSVLKTIYHGLFESIINYEIIAWSGVSTNAVKPLMIVQNRLLKFFASCNDVNVPLNINETFIVSALTYYYNECKDQYRIKQIQTRSNLLTLPIIKKSISTKNAYYVAIKYFNLLPNNLKSLNCNQKLLKKKLRSWICNKSD